jgi:drug/metabolite transporter (DMT)-like permease
VQRRHLLALVVLGAVWGSSYLFIKVAVRAFAPTTMVSFRLLASAPFLYAILVARAGGIVAARRELRAAVGPAAVLALTNAAIPYVLIGVGEQHVDSGVAAIANSTVPIFVALLALRYRRSERVTGLRLAGIVVGLGGVALLTGARASGGWWAIGGTLAVVFAAVWYAASSLYAQGPLQHLSGPAVATAMMGLGGLVLVPPALVQLPQHAPGWKPVASILGLALLGTVFAQILYLYLLEHVGASRTALVNYVYPVFAVVYGAAFLSERITSAKVGGMALILAGVALGSGVVGRRRALVR